MQMIVFVAFHTATRVDPNLARDETREVPTGLYEAVRTRLSAMRLRAGVDADLQARLLVA
ncbi:MAG TPA: hypothetical protein VM933_08155 [Acidimicrobiales bacterium]|nr:hypothetical protein [Acidimicrobiales bacterium]